MGTNESERKQIVSELQDLEQKADEMRYFLSEINELEEEAVWNTKRAKRLQEESEEDYQSNVKLKELLFEKGAVLREKEKMETEAFSDIRRLLKDSLEEDEEQIKQFRNQLDQEEQ